MAHEATMERAATPEGIDGDRGCGKGHLIGIMTECGGDAVKHAKLLREHARVLGERLP